MIASPPSVTLRSGIPAATSALRAIAAGALLLGAAVAPASAAPPGTSPIDLRSCAVAYAPSTEQVYAMGMRVPEGVTVAFVNRGAVAIDEVRFTFGDGPDAVSVADRGSFAPGAVIRHEFVTGARPVATCRVVAVRYAGATAFATIGPRATASR